MQSIARSSKDSGKKMLVSIKSVSVHRAGKQF